MRQPVPRTLASSRVQHMARTSTRSCRQGVRSDPADTTAGCAPGSSDELRSGLRVVGLRLEPAARHQHRRGEALMDDYSRLRRCAHYLQGIVAEARQTGFTATILGRRRYLPDLLSDNGSGGRWPRDGLNAPIQGLRPKASGRDAQERAGARGRGSRRGCCIQVHDELVFEVAQGERTSSNNLCAVRGCRGRLVSAAGCVRRRRPYMARGRALS